jgi:hypothetical protein
MSTHVVVQPLSAYVPPSPNRQHCGIAAGVTRLGGPPREALYTLTLLRVAWQFLNGGRVFIRPRWSGWG